MTDEILASADLGNGRSVHIATLARETIRQSGADHLGFSGYFLFEVNDRPGEQAINILGKVSSFEAALRLADIFGNAFSADATHSSSASTWQE